MPFWLTYEGLSEGKKLKAELLFLSVKVYLYERLFQMIYANLFLFSYHFTILLKNDD